MTTADTIAAVLRPIAPRGQLAGEDVPLINQIAAAWDARLVADPAGGSRMVPDPAWIIEARKLIGQREIVGPQHNSWIAKGWAALGAGWFNDDETPWCGFFVAHCLNRTGLPFPGKGQFARALSWADWGTACTPRLGAIGVKTRQGGGHVFFIVGITPDGRYYKALGGNQSNMVSVVDIPVTAVTAIRWPQGAPPANIALPKLAAGTVSSNEA